MQFTRDECCILNSGNGSWAFEPLAKQLSDCLGIAVSDKARRFNYLLHVENMQLLGNCPSFIPVEAIRLASDKRLLAKVFNEHKVPTPETRIIETFDLVRSFIAANKAKQWCLKYPTSCGANGHMFVVDTTAEPANWPKPFVVQEFIQLHEPEVYRIYCAGGELFGWVVRRYPEGKNPSPWVAHARGAQYAILRQPPAAASEAARAALVATGLINSFGCADLLCKPDGDWVVLEVGTDGLFNHVDRNLGNSDFEKELNQRIAHAIWRSAS